MVQSVPVPDEQPALTCPMCGWSEHATRSDNPEGRIYTPWQRYQVHVFLEHHVPLPSRDKFDLHGNLMDGD